MDPGAWNWLTMSGLLLGQLCCLLVLVQDLRGRWVHLLPLGGILAGGLTFHFSLSGTETWAHLGINLGMLTALMLLVWAFFKWQKKPLKEMIGAGDVVLLYALAVWLEPVGYWIFYVVGMWMVLLAVLVGRALGWLRKDYPIPLAGLLAGAFVIWFWIWVNFRGEVVNLLNL